MDIFDLSERFAYYKNYGQIIVGKWKKSLDQVCFSMTLSDFFHMQ